MKLPRDEETVPLGGEHRLAAFLVPVTPLTMSLEQLEFSILALTPDERKRFAQCSRNTVALVQNIEGDELTAEQQAESFAAATKPWRLMHP